VIQEICQDPNLEQDKLCIWDAADWFAGIGSPERQAAELGITAATTDAELAEIVERETECALADPECDEFHGAAEHLEEVRWWCRHSR